MAGVGDIKPAVTPVSPVHAPRRVEGGKERRGGQGQQQGEHRNQHPLDDQDDNDNHIDEYA